jgi:hypothetical protein
MPYELYVYTGEETIGIGSFPSLAVALTEVLASLDKQSLKDLETAPRSCLSLSETLERYRGESVLFSIPDEDDRIDLIASEDRIYFAVRLN